MGIEEGGLSFEGFFADEYGRLFRAMWLMTGSQSEGEELAQEALVRAYERWDRVRTAASPVGYVYRIALNLHRGRLRRALALARRALADGPGRDEIAQDEIAQAETRTEVLGAIRALPRAQREALILVDWLQFTPEEASRVLGIESGSVRGRLHRARTALRSKLGGLDE
jgi:RNA polymerase sigma factor (sigma-70 family)